MSALPNLPDPAVNPQKARKGFERVWHATLISLHGLRAGWSEPAFRQEAILSIVIEDLARLEAIAYGSRRG